MKLKHMVCACCIAAAMVVGATGQTNTVYAAETAAEVQEEAAIDWENTLLVVVDEDDSLTIRKTASADSTAKGKIYRGGIAEVLNIGEKWTRISSGGITGYVKTQYCLFGEEAEAAAEEICGYIATVTADSVRLRSGAGTDYAIYATVSEGSTLIVDAEAETAEGWVAVEYDTATAYICADYVTVSLNTSEATTVISIQSKKTKTVYSESDITLLAALIQCEAGGECYAGKLAVGAVVMNRIKSSSFPSTLSGVIYQSGQFTPVRSGKLARVLKSGNISASCYKAAKAAMAGSDNTNGALYFHAGSGKGTKIGNQVFY